LTASVASVNVRYLKSVLST